MTNGPDAIDEIVRELKKRRKECAPNEFWDAVNNELRSYVAELQHPPGPWGERGTQTKFLTAGVRDAPALLAKVWEHFSHASKLSNALEDYGARTYGWPGQFALPFEAVRTLDAALQIIAEHLVRHDEALKTNTAKIGTTQGSKGGLLARINGTPVQRFLQRFRNIWVAASGKEVLGEPFETAAKTLLEIALPPNRSGWRRELGDLGRQIKNAKKRGYEVKTEWDAINDIENMDLNALQYRRE